MKSEDITKLLIVDHNTENLRTLGLLVGCDDRHIVQARSGVEALARLQEYDFALVILETELPDMTGVELAEIMRRTAKTCQIPIMFINDLGQEPNFAFAGHELGAVDFVYRPLAINAVQNKVNLFVALHRQRMEINRHLNALQKNRAEQEELARALHEAQAELQRADQVRDAFMSMLAHELRTPLNTLSLETQLRTLQINSGNFQFFNETDLRKMIARDERQIKSMVRLIDEILDASRIRADRDLVSVDRR